MSVNDYDPIIESAAKEWNVDPNLLRAMMQQESGGNPTQNGKPIRSSAGAGGLMQIMPGTASGLGVENVDVPVQNIYGAAKLMSQLLDKYQRPELALAAYNAKPETVDAWLAGKGDLPAETKTYVPSVAANYAHYAKTVALAPSGIPSDDDFLKSINPQVPAGTPMMTIHPGAAVPSDEDFLKAINPQGTESTISAPTPSSVSTPASQLTMGNPSIALNAAGGDQWIPTPASPTPLSSSYRATTAALAPAPGTTYGDILPIARDDATGQIRPALPNAWRSLAQGAVDLAFGPALGTVTPQATAALANVVPGLMTSPAAGMGGAIAATAARRGGQSAPLAAAPSVTPFTPVAAPAFNPASPSFNYAEQPPPGLVVRMPVAPEGSFPYAASTSNALTPTTEVPNSLSAAATPTQLVAMSPRELAASQATGEMQRVLEPAKPGIDTTIYVPGTKPTEAEVSGSPSVAFDQKLNRQQNPDPHVAQEKSNNDARVEYYDQAAGTPTMVNRLKEARSEQANTDLEAAFGNKKPTDAQPVVDTINGILNDPRLGERDLVKKYVSPFLDQLQKEDGTLKDDPESLYGIRENVADKLSKAFAASDPAINQVKPQLMQIKNALDQAIENGAPGYKDYLANYSEASRPIDAMEYLQDNRPKLTNANGTMMPGSYDRFMKNTVSDRAAGGVQPAASLTQDQMEVLHNIHSDLKRAQNINLANPRGSDTSMLTEGVKNAANLVAHGVANYMAPVLGSVALGMGKNALQRRALSKMTDRVLNPNPLQYPPTEP